MFEFSGEMWAPGPGEWDSAVVMRGPPQDTYRLGLFHAQLTLCKLIDTFGGAVFPLTHNFSHSQKKVSVHPVFSS